MAYPKFKKDNECAFPERKICNWDENDLESKRCPFMKYNNEVSIFSSERWHCTYQKDKDLLKSEQKEDKSLRELNKEVHIT